MSRVADYIRLRERFEDPVWLRRWKWTAHADATQREMDRIYARLTERERQRVRRWERRQAQERRR